jgi:hypothetical protein
MLGVTLQLFDHMTGGMKGAMTAVDGFRAKAEAAFSSVRGVGANTLGLGLVLAGALQKPINAFAELEDAQTRLKSVMMAN